MARGDDQAKAAEKTANSNANTLFGNSQGLYSSLAPMLTSQAAHPAGFSDSDLAGMETDAQEGAGGSNAGAVGQGSLLAARTRNAGSAAAPIADAARESGAELSRNRLGVRIRNASLKQDQHDSALRGMEGLYGVNTGASNQALGAVADNSRANSAAIDQSWGFAKNILAPAMAAAGNAAKASGCWIAEAIYGIDSPQTNLVRAYLNGPFRESFIGGLVMDIYLAIGRPVACMVRRSWILRRAFRPIFNLALKKAVA